MKYRSIFASQDLKSKMKDYFKVNPVSREQIALAFGIEVFVNPSLPLDSAVFVNHLGEIVGLYSDGKLVEIAQDSAINYLAPYPLAVKKKPLLDKDDE